MDRSRTKDRGERADAVPTASAADNGRLCHDGGGVRAARPATAPPEGGYVGYPLLEEGRVAVAEVISRSDLGLDGKLGRACQHPDNLWSLHGLHECLARPGETVEAALIKQCLDPGAG